MCGILVSFNQRSDEVFEATWDALMESNSARGPDASRMYTVAMSHSMDGQEQLDLRFFASELWLRGGTPVTQPHIEGDDVLCWNGEVFQGLDMTNSDNDGVCLLRHLRQLDNPDELINVFATIEGPYAFVYYNGRSRRLYFGRDPLGRRSLLYQLPSQQYPRLLLASVSTGSNPLYSLDEHPTESISCVDLGESFLSSKHRFINRNPSKSSPGTTFFVEPGKVSKVISSSERALGSLEDVLTAELSTNVNDLLLHLSRSVELRVCDIPFRRRGEARVAVLFSGGIDSTMIAFLANRYLPMSEPIDLLNVAFENPRKIRVDAERQADQNRTGRTRQQKGVHDSQAAVGMGYKYLVPDRVTGLEEIIELRKLCPNRQWNFVEINVAYEESLRGRAVIEDLMYPSRTVMDMSLGMALYYASRGVGQIDNAEGNRESYTSPARVLLSGLGSDELLGGYGRHRTAFKTGGWEAVLNELQEEIDRIPIRNLGRDDRVVSSNGKETRHPFLSLSVVDFLCKLPANMKMDPQLPLGVGDKMLLRLAARKEGLLLASGRKKRAMQFGTHSARMEGNGKDRRGDILF